MFELMDSELAKGPLMPPYLGPYTIPILIDDVKQLESFNMTRGTFFTIDANGMGDDWVAILRSRWVPFLLLGVTASLHRPDLFHEKFRSAASIDRLFGRIEEVEGLVVESEHIWLPNILFDPHIEKYSPKRKPVPLKRGAVWRVGFGLFQMALTFRDEVIEAGTYMERCRQLMELGQIEVSYSQEETDAYHAWSVEQIEAARKNFLQQREDPSRGVLAYVDLDGRVVSQTRGREEDDE
jgi:hypothetical protein